MNHRDGLVDAIKRGELVVVAGTGVSTTLAGDAKVTSWNGLMADGIARVKLNDAEEAAMLEMRLEKATDPAALTGLAADLRRELGADFGRWVALTVGALKVGDDRLATALAKLGVPIFTTNYDELLEQALNRSGVSWTNPDEMREVVLGRSNAIGHLHGVHSAADSLIFTAGDYERIRSTPAARAVQESIFNGKRVLFVGVGMGLHDPNFRPMVEDFENNFPSSGLPHYRLCRDSEADPASDIRPVVDVGFGANYEDLVGFLDQLAAECNEGGNLQLRVRARDRLLEQLREKSTLWRDADALNEKALGDLVVTPIFLPEPHDRFSTSSVLEAERERPVPVDITDFLSGGQIVVIAGEENSGVTTALIWALAKAMDHDSDSHALLVAEPLAPGKDAIDRVVQRTYREWGFGESANVIAPRGVLGIDNLRFEDSDKFSKAIAGIKIAAHSTKIVGVREGDALDIAKALSESDEDRVHLVYLGRFGTAEVREIARRIAPGREDQVTRMVMVVIREKNLPRTPFTAALLAELVQSGVKLKRGESEIQLLDQYLDLLLSYEFGRQVDGARMTVRNKRLVLEQLSRRLVESRNDFASQSQVLEWFTEQFVELGWTFDALNCLNDLIARRVLSRGPDSTIRFQRSAYLELMAGLAAKEDVDFRALVLGSPLQLASIVRTYAAMARNDQEVLRVVSEQIDLISTSAVSGGIFASVRRIEPKGDNVFASHEDSDPDEEAATEDGDATGLTEKPRESYYDDSDDSDAPAFLTARLEDLPPARIAMLVVDLASRVLRDSDEIRDQQVKEDLLRKVLIAWVRFTDLFEAELGESDSFADHVKNFYPGEDISDDDKEVFRRALLLLYPTILTAAGVRHCLSGPSLVKRLSEIDMKGEELGSYASLVRTIALYGTGATEWIDSLRQIDDDAIRTFFSVTFLTSLARYAYIVDRRLSDEQRLRIQEFLRRVMEVRYKFDDVEHRNRSFNKFEDGLRRARLTERQSPPRGIEIAV